MNDEMKEILGDFLAETTEMLESLDQQFVTLEHDPGNADLLNEIFRCMHSMKGGAGFLGFSHLVEVAHHAESLMNKLRTGEMAATSSIVDIILEAVDVIKSLQDDIRSTGEDTHVETDLIVTKLTLTLESAADLATAAPAAATTEAPTAPGAQETTSAEVPSAQPTPSPATSDTSASEEPSSPPATVSNSPTGSEHSMPTSEAVPSTPALTDMLSKMKETTSRIEAASQTQAKSHAPREEDQSVRVETRRLDHVMNLVGELVLGRNRLIKLGGGLEEQYENDGLVRTTSMPTPRPDTSVT